MIPESTGVLFFDVRPSQVRDPLVGQALTGIGTLRVVLAYWACEFGVLADMYRGSR